MVSLNTGYISQLPLLPCVAIRPREGRWDARSVMCNCCKVALKVCNVDAKARVPAAISGHKVTLVLEAIPKITSRWNKTEGTWVSDHVGSILWADYPPDFSHIRQKLQSYLCLHYFEFCVIHTLTYRNGSLIKRMLEGYMRVCITMDIHFYIPPTKGQVLFLHRAGNSNIRWNKQNPEEWGHFTALKFFLPIYFSRWRSLFYQVL